MFKLPDDRCADAPLAEACAFEPRAPYREAADDDLAATFAASFVTGSGLVSATRDWSTRDRQPSPPLEPPSRESEDDFSNLAASLKRLREERARRAAANQSHGATPTGPHPKTSVAAPDSPLETKLQFLEARIARLEAGHGAAQPALADIAGPRSDTFTSCEAGAPQPISVPFATAPPSTGPSGYGAAPYRSSRGFAAAPANRTDRVPRRLWR